jgi:hypothetical protein
MTKKKGTLKVPVAPKGSDRDDNPERSSRPNNPIVRGRETPFSNAFAPEADQDDPEQQEPETVIEPPMTRRVTRSQSRLSTTSTQDVRDSLDGIPVPPQERVSNQRARQGKRPETPLSSRHEERGEPPPVQAAPIPTVLEGFDDMYLEETEAIDRAQSASAWAGEQVRDHQRRYDRVVSPIVEEDIEASQEKGKKLDVVQGVLDEVWDLLRVQQEEMMELKAVRRAEAEKQGVTDASQRDLGIL